MTSQKCQLSQKIHGLVIMDRFKTTCPKQLKSFFNTYPKWVFFHQNFLIKKKGILVVCIGGATHRCK